LWINPYGDKYERLLEIKRKYDPDNVFHRNQNIKP
jgi:FAD/FMN-containing dehydrogenase